MIYYVYKIVCNDVSVTDFYVGSTACFRKRKSHHKSICNNSNDKLYNLKIYQTIRANGGWDNWRMVIIEEMIDTTLVQARIREEHYRVELGASLNMVCCGTGLTKKEYKKEWYETNKEQLKDYRETNKEHIKEYKKVYNQTEKQKEYQKEYQKTEKRKEYMKEYRRKQKEKKDLDKIII